jgi:hypothetical protein
MFYSLLVKYIQILRIRGFAIDIQYWSISVKGQAMQLMLPLASHLASAPMKINYTTSAGALTRLLTYIPPSTALITTTSGRVRTAPALSVVTETIIVTVPY